MRRSTRLVTAGLASDIGTRSTSFRLEVNRRRLDRLEETVLLKIRDAVNKTTVDIQAQTMLNIRERDLIDTGNLLNSIAASTSLDGMTGFVDVGAEYGIYLEFGTVKMSARPFLGPAVDRIGPGFVSAVRRAVREGIQEAS